MARIIICRHPRTNDNARGIYSGQQDTPLNARGEIQAARLTNQIAEEFGGQIGLVVSSDLQRASFLATMIGKRLNVEARATRGLREVNIGDMTGVPKGKAIAQFPEARYRTTNPEFDFSDIGGEDAVEVIARQRTAIDEGITALPDGKLLLVVGHGSALRLLFVQHLGHLTTLHEQGEYQEVEW